MKCLLIFPPQWVPFNPHLAPAAIQGILKENGHQVNYADLNISFYNSVLTPNFINQSLDRAFKFYNQNIVQINEIRKQKKDLKEFPADFQKIYLRFKEIEKINANKQFVSNIVSNIQVASNIIKDKKQFYNPYNLDRAFNVVKGATDILSGIYYPSKVNFLNIMAQASYDINELKINCTDKYGNIFYTYFEMILPKLLSQNPEFIGISLGDYTQLIPALTLSMMLKKATKAHILIGGNLFGRYTDVLINSPEFFELFTDSIIYNEGEKPIIELIKYLKNDIKIEDVPNLIYFKDGQVKFNQEQEPLKINELAVPDFTNSPLSLYYTPEVIFNIQTSRDCYWKKCTFCTHHHGSKYGIKTVDKVINDIKNLQKNFNAKYFHFVDEAMSPAYLRKLSEKIIDEKLDIKFYIYGRLEKEFNSEVFDLAYKAGLRLIMWGFESANERIYKLMNKGELTSPVARQKILSDAYNSGIWNHLFIMFNFPSESVEEAKETIDFLRDNRYIASHSKGGKFVLLENAPILKDLKKYHITKVEKFRSGFHFANKFETDCDLTKEQQEELEKYKVEQWRLKELKYQNSWFREKLFLYVCRYGVQNISKMKDKIWL